MPKVISGAYKGTETWWLPGKAKRDDVYITEVELIDYANSKELSGGKALVGGLMFGAAGAIVGGAIGKRKKNFLVKITYDTGEESIAEADQTAYDKLMDNIYEVTYEEDE